MYLILMNPTENKQPYYGAIVIMNNVPYYVTSLAYPTLFKTEKEALREIRRLEKGRPDDTFTVVDVDTYLTIVDQDFTCKWIKQMRQEQMEMGMPK